MVLPLFRFLQAAETATHAAHVCAHRPARRSARRLKQEQEARSTSSSEIAQASQSYWNGIADLRTNLAQTKINQYNADRNYELSMKKYQASQAQAAYSQAMQRWQTYGYVLPADAAILGVKAGTQTADKAYKDAQLALSRWKALQSRSALRRHRHGIAR